MHNIKVIFLMFYLNLFFTEEANMWSLLDFLYLARIKEQCSETIDTFMLTIDEGKYFI